MPKGLRSLRFTFEDATLTHYGGMALLQQFCRKLNLKRLLQTYVSWERRDSIYHSAELLLCLIYSMVAGLKRISDTRILAYNRSFQRLLGLERFPSETTLRDFLKSISSKELKGIMKVHDLLRNQMRSIPKVRTSFILDMDSTVLPLYGWTIQGARVGYNPKKPLRPSYHPVVVFDGQTQDTLYGMLRPGDTHPVTAAKRVFRISCAKLPKYGNRKRVSVRLRADAGFYDGNFVQFLDSGEISYVIVAKMSPPIKAMATRLRFRTFRQKGKWQVATTLYKPVTWDYAHRLILVRRPKPQKQEESRQLTLWEYKDFFYHAFVSNLKLKGASTYRFYNGRANAELDLRELKEGLPLGRIPTAQFTANATHFQLILLAYDLLNWFRRLCLSGKWKTAKLQTLRYELFMLPARLLQVAHRNVLKLPKGYPHRKRFYKALKQIQKLRIS